MPILWIHSGEAGIGGAIQLIPGDFACKAFFTRILCHLKGHLKGHAIIGQAWQSRKGGFVQLHLPKGHWPVTERCWLSGPTKAAFGDFMGFSSLIQHLSLKSRLVINSQSPRGFPFGSSYLFGGWKDPHTFSIPSFFPTLQIALWRASHIHVFSPDLCPEYKACLSNFLWNSCNSDSICQNWIHRIFPQTLLCSFSL